MEAPLPTILAPGPPPPSGGWAATAPAAPVASFRAGGLISGAFRTWGRGLPVFVPLGLVAQAPGAVGIYLLYASLPTMVAELAGDPGAGMAALWQRMGLFAGWWLVAMAAALVQIGAVTAAAGRLLAGERARLGAALVAGLRRLPAVLGVCLLAWLAMIPAACALFFPMLILLCGWCAAVPAVVLEGRGPIAALSRSWALTRGSRWPVLGGFLALWLVVMLASGLAQGVGLAAVLAVAGPAGLEPGPAMALPMALYQLVAGVLYTLLLVAAAVAHHGLRLAREGGDPALLARVFE